MPTFVGEPGYLRRMRVAILAVVWIGCFTGPAPHTASAPATAAEPQRPATKRSIPRHSTWIGSYRCAQGVTALTLAIDAQSSGEALAVFEFGALVDNPDVPGGSYRMRGRIDMQQTGELRVRLAPERWITQPDGYEMVSLTATSDVAHRGLRGRIDHPACGELVVRRRN